MPITDRPANYLYLLFALCFFGGVFGGISSTLMSAYLPDVVKEFSNKNQLNTDQIGAAINAAYLFGMMFGGLSIGVFSDRFGRKLAFQTAAGFIGLFMLLTGFAENWATIGVFRFFTGFGVGGILVTSTTLISEEWTEKKRNVALGILSITIPVGIFSAGLITYNFTNWRTGFLIGIVPLLIAITAQFKIRETLKWIENRKNRIEKNEKSLSIFDSSIRHDLIIGSVIYGSMLIGLWAIFAWLPTWVQTLVHDSDGQKERGISMMLFASGGLIGGFISGWVGNFIGVKRSLLTSFAAVFLLTFFLFKLNTDLNLIAYFEMALIALFFGFSQGVLNGYIPELFPTKIRSSATGFCFNIGRVFTASVVFFVGWLVAFLGGYGNALFMFSFVFLIGFVASLFSKTKPSEPI